MEDTFEDLKRRCVLLEQQLQESSANEKRERASADQLRRALEQERLRVSKLERQIQNVDESLVDATNQRGKGYVHTFGMQDPTFMAEVEAIEARLGMSPTVDQQLRALGIDTPAQLEAATTDEEALFEAASLPRGPSEALAAAFAVVDYLVEAIKKNPDIRYYCGRDTQTFRLLTEAMAARFRWLLREDKSAEEIAEALWVGACNKPAEVELLQAELEKRSSK